MVGKKRLHATLLELLIVIAILVSIAGVIAISTIKAKRDQQFRSEVERVVTQLRLAQDLMLTFHGDVQLRLAVLPNDQGFGMKLEFDHPLPLSWMKEVQNVPKPLTTIHSIDFIQADSEDEIIFKFLSGGAAMSQGIVRVATSSRSMLGILERFIPLQGFPAPIVSTASLDEAEDLMEEMEEDGALHQKTIEEVKAQLAI